MKSNGSIYVTVPNWESLNKKIGFYAKMIDTMHFLSDVDLKLGHKRTYSVDSIKEQVLKCGFKIDAIEGLFLKPITTSQMKELNFSEEIYKALMILGKEYPELSCGIMLKLSL